MGTIKFKKPILVNGASVPYVLPAATASAIGGVKKPTTVIADSVQASAPTTAEFNALLAVLRTAGVIASA